MISKDDELVAFMEGLAPRARLIGVDLGTKTIGLALSDVEKRIATPLETSSGSSSPPMPSA
jgi:putative Holliday junction resolvase